jgi:alkane 1-monooxygenase
MESDSSTGMTTGVKYKHIAFCFLPLVLFVLLWTGIYLGGWWLALPIVFLMAAIPALDMITGWQDTLVFEKEQFSATELFLLHWNVRLYAIFYVGSVTWIALSLHRFTGLEIGLLIGSAGLIGGIGFGAAHELLHGKEDIDMFIQRVATAFLFYPHYRLIHIRSHHLHAGTDHDENTAWMNETIYSYIARTIPGSMIRSWQLEARRTKGDGSLGALLKNQMTRYLLWQIALLGTLLGFGGLAGLLFYFAHVFVAHLVLESVNYIQHYGLLRDKNDGGEYERTGPEHSWDTYHFFSSYITFRVGHHSYHHIAVQPYYLLVAEPEAPKLPVGYFWAIPVVLLPPWWRSMIHPRLKAATPGSGVGDDAEHGAVAV